VPTRKFVVNLKTAVYHRLDCEFGQKINPENRLYYFRKEDVQKGFRPCRVCTPDDIK
jgi:methylphosphotriester-DNA--protein-cysteine methyltransferase